MTRKERPVGFVAVTERYAVHVTGALRRLYRYLTGDASCLGFVRLACTLSMVLVVVAVALCVQARDLPYAGVYAASCFPILVGIGPVLFKIATYIDQSPIGPNAKSIFPPLVTGLTSVTTVVILIASVLGLVNVAARVPLYTGSVPWILGLWAMVLAMWAPYDSDGGKGERTLTKDLRRLTRRTSPVLAGNEAS